MIARIWAEWLFKTNFFVLIRFRRKEEIADVEVTRQGDRRENIPKIFCSFSFNEFVGV